MSQLPSLTVLLGPQTSLSLALNAIIRDHKHALQKAGLNSLPSRFASPILRHAIDDRPLEVRRIEFLDSLPKLPTFLSAVNFFGPPHEGLAKREMFPRAEQSLARLAEVAPDMRICICVDTLPAFFLASASEILEARVQNTPWEALFELSWADLALEVKDAMAGSEIVILTPKAALKPETLRSLVGKGALAPDLLLKSQVSETGRAVLDRMEPEQVSDSKVIADLYSSFSTRPKRHDIETRLGLDRVTQLLLQQRFDEDVAVMQSMPGISVLA
ncbi:MAG: hypothetical protein AAFX07_07590 [Pseudomonadota bacterium]